MRVVQPRKSQQIDNPMTSRKSLKQLQQLKRSQMKFDPETSLGGQEDQSTQNSNNLDQNSKKRRSGASFYMGSNNGQNEDNGCFEPSPWAVYQADLYGYYDKPKWYPSYHKHNKNLPQKIKAFGFGDPIPMTTIQTSLNLNQILKISQKTSCQDKK